MILFGLIPGLLMLSFMFGVLVGETEREKKDKPFKQCQYGHNWDYSYDPDQIVEYKICRTCGKRISKGGNLK